VLRDIEWVFGTKGMHMRSMLQITGLLLLGFSLAVSAQQYRVSGRIPLEAKAAGITSLWTL